MKKLVAIFAISTLLVFAAFGQQATTVAPAQSPTPAPAKRARAATPKPAIPATGQNERHARGQATTIAPVQPSVTSAPIETAITVPARIGITVAVQATPTAPVPATTMPSVGAVQVATPPTAQIAPTPNLRVAATQPALAPPTQLTPPSPTVAAQTIPGAASPLPQIASTRPAAVAVAQQATTHAPVAAGSREPDYVEEKGFKGKVFEVKYREPDSLVRAVSSLSSGFKGAKVSSNDEFKTITVRDFPENIAAIEEALKRLDTPQAPRPDIEFRIHVLIGSATAGQGEEVPSDLKDVVNQLQSTLKYKNYNLMVSAMHRTKAGGQGLANNGVAESKLFNSISVPAGNQIFYDYNIGSINLDASTTAGTTVQIGNFVFSMRIPLVIGGPNSPIQYQNVGFRSPVSLREGEKVIVGTTTMGDKGLIVVLMARVNK